MSLAVLPFPHGRLRALWCPCGRLRHGAGRAPSASSGQAMDVSGVDHRPGSPTKHCQGPAAPGRDSVGPPARLALGGVLVRSCGPRASEGRDLPRPPPQTPPPSSFAPSTHTPSQFQTSPTSTPSLSAASDRFCLLLFSCRTDGRTP